MNKKWCYLLYSVKDVLEFLCFEEKDKCQIVSIQLDGQKAFVITCFDEDVALRYEEFCLNADSTMLGCLDSSVPLHEESLQSLGRFITNGYN